MLRPVPRVQPREAVLATRTALPRPIGRRQGATQNEVELTLTALDRSLARRWATT